MLKNISKEKAISLLRQCLGAIGSPAPGPITERARIWSREGQFVSILEPGVTAFNALVNMIVDAGKVDDGRGVKDIFSRKYLETEVESLIGRLVVEAASDGREPRDLSSSAITEVWKEWRDKFQIPSDTAVYYAVVANLVLEAPVQIGSVTLLPLDDEAVSGLLRDIGEVMDGSLGPEESRQFARQTVEREFAPGFGRTLARANVAGAEPLRAQEVFQERVREVLHCLIFFSYFSPGADLHKVLDFAGSVGSGRNLIVRLVSGQQVSIHGGRNVFPCELTGDRVASFNELGLGRLGNILSKEPGERTKLEKSCLNAITWASRGLQDEVPDSSLLKLCVAMESLLLSRGAEPYGKTMGERAAFLLGQDPEARAQIADQVAEIYKARSAVAHEGHSPRVEEQLGPTRFYATRSILMFLRRKWEHGWQCLEDFSAWCDKLRFGVPESWSPLAWAGEFVSVTNELLNLIEHMRLGRHGFTTTVAREGATRRLKRMLESAAEQAAKLDEIGDPQLGELLGRVDRLADQMGLGRSEVTPEELAKSVSSEDLDAIRVILDDMAGRLLEMQRDSAG